MKIATISQTKNQLSAILDKVRHGETVLIVDRDQPIARLEPVVASETLDPDGRLSRLERAGLVRRGRGAIPARLLKEPPVAAVAGGNILEAVLAERRGGR